MTQSETADTQDQTRKRRRRRRRNRKPVGGENGGQPQNRGDGDAAASQSASQSASSATAVLDAPPRKNEAPNDRNGQSKGNKPQGGHKHNNKKKQKNRGNNQNKPQHQHHNQQHQPQHGGGGKPPRGQQMTGLLEITDKGVGYLRQEERYYRPHRDDPQLPTKFIQRYRLRPGVDLVCQVEPRKGQPPQIVFIEKVMGMGLGEWQALRSIDDLRVINPREHLKFETLTPPPNVSYANDMTTRIIDLFCPVGLGQRALIVAPPRTGKTIILQKLAHGASANRPDCHLMVLLIDERPEEVTEMRRSIDGVVIASSNDEPLENHVRTSRLAIEHAKRRVELGENVVMMMDSITRLGRAFNNYVGSSGRTMTGGLDINALEEPKRMFGAARNIEDGGSLTIIATALVDTGSRADEFIFQEFKGTGNSEIVLDRDMANRRVFPAIDLQQSGTRNEHLLLGERQTDQLNRHVRRKLMDMRGSNIDRMDSVKKMLGHHKTNADLFAALPG